MSINDVLDVEGWLTINSNGSTRFTKGKPSVGWDEISIALKVRLPTALFHKPRLEAKITIPQEAAVSDPITSEVVENVKEAIETATGLTISVNVIKHEEVEQP